MKQRRKGAVGVAGRDEARRRGALNISRRINSGNLHHKFSSAWDILWRIFSIRGSVQAGAFWHAPRKWRRALTSRNPRFHRCESKREENGKEGHQGSRGWLASLDWSAGWMEGVVESRRLYRSLEVGSFAAGDTTVNRAAGLSLCGERVSSSSLTC